MLHTDSSPGPGRLLATLPSSERRRFVERCETVELVFGAVIQRPGALISRVLFPTKGFVSLLTPAGGKDRMETGLIGDEGMLGAALLLGVGRARTLAIVQGAGKALVMDARVFRHQLERSEKLRATLGRYTQVTMLQLAQMVVCARFHVVEERLARWLLMTADRAHSADFPITHEFLASMLGVRRAGVTRAAGALDALELIRYRRGEMSIKDRRGLERAACVCYATDRATYTAEFSRGASFTSPPVRAIRRST